MSDTPTRPTTDDDREGWKAYWAAQGMPWRTEPEIDEERQGYLAERRAVKPDIEKGIYPFRDESGGITLTRADVEWLLATHESGGMAGPVERDDPAQRRRAGLDLRGAMLNGLDLRSLPLARLQGGLPRDGLSQDSEQKHLLVALHAALHLEGTLLSHSHMEDAMLTYCHLEGAVLHQAHLEGANLYGAHFEGNPPANMRDAIFDANSMLARATLGNKHRVGPTCLSVRWNDTILTAIEWSSVRITEDENMARNRRTTTGEAKPGKVRLREFDRAVQTYRQLAVALSSQGLDEHANRFAYRAQLCQGVVFRRQHHYLRYLGSKFLWLIGGYGYRPLRSLITYLVVVGAFAGLYALLAHLGLTKESFGSWDSPLVLSVTSFHGRVFFAGQLPLTDWAARVGAVEATIGLLVEITFIATFTNRFFAR